MQEFDNVESQLARVKTAQAEMNARIAAMPPAGPNIAPAALQAVADSLSMVADQMNATVPAQ